MLSLTLRSTSNTPSPMHALLVSHIALLCRDDLIVTNKRPSGHCDAANFTNNGGSKYNTRRHQLPYGFRPQAQVDMIEETLKWAGATGATNVLDVGCGIGGSSRHIARKYGCSATGITLSPKQVRTRFRKHLAVHQHGLDGGAMRRAEGKWSKAMLSNYTMGNARLAYHTQWPTSFYCRASFCHWVGLTACVLCTLLAAGGPWQRAVRQGWPGGAGQAAGDAAARAERACSSKFQS